MPATIAARLPNLSPSGSSMLWRGEVDPESVSQKREALALSQDCRNEPESALFLPREHALVFFLNPARRHGFGRHHQHARPRALDRVVERSRDQITRTLAPVVKPDCEPLALQISRESLDPGFVFALVADEDVILRVAVRHFQPRGNRSTKGRPSPTPGL